MLVESSVEAGWAKAERAVAKKAFDIAYEREILTLIQTLRSRLNAISNPEDIWNLHDFLSAKRHEIDGKFDFRDSSLIFVFAGLVKDGLLQLSELEGLNSEKLSKIAALSRM
jgi:hypothetical protein